MQAVWNALSYGLGIAGLLDWATWAPTAYWPCHSSCVWMPTGPCAWIPLNPSAPETFVAGQVQQQFATPSAMTSRSSNAGRTSKSTGGIPGADVGRTVAFGASVWIPKRRNKA